nr:androgen-dependent TFPI-regulating protein-like isoform X2 [Onthophagus taurus]
MGVKTFYYFALVSYYYFAIYYDQKYVDLSRFAPEKYRGKEPFGGKLKYLTIWNVLLQSFFFTICFLNELIGTSDLIPPPKKTSLIRKFKDILLPSLAFPLSMFVGLTFWALYAIDRELVFPKVIDPYFPSWLNHVMHTNIMIFILIEMFTAFRKYPSRKIGLGILTVFMLAYLGWIHVIHAYTNLWVYPVLDVLNLPGRVGFFLGLFCLSSGLYLLGEKLNAIVWRKQLSEKSKRK